MASLACRTYEFPFGPFYDTLLMVLRMDRKGKTMLVAVTGATGFLGQYIVREFLSLGWNVRAWMRSGRIPAGLEFAQVEWYEGDLRRAETNAAFLHRADVLVHAAFEKSRGKWFSDETTSNEFHDYLQHNLLGSLRLIDDARRAGVARCVFVSSAAVYGKILLDRPLDETHPLWPSSPYGACKASIEAFISGLASGYDWPVCSVRPPSIYGLAELPESSKFFDVVQRAMRGSFVDHPTGAKQVHAADVAKAIALVIDAPRETVKGEAFNCYDRFISDDQVIEIVQQLTGQSVNILQRAPSPKNIIDTRKIRSLGMEFGGQSLLEQTVRALVDTIRIESE